MELLSALGINLAIMLSLMTVLWLLSLKLNDSSVVDPFWGLGFVIVAWVTFALREATGQRSWLLVTMVTVWGLRLSGFLLWRNWGEGEDPRYADMRRHHGEAYWWRSYLTVFLLQGFLLWLIAHPLQAGLVASVSPLNWLDGVGFAIWFVGLFFETVGDWQLQRFKSNPRNSDRVLDSGLWRLTRHPNYFGDFCVWWGLYLVAIQNGATWTALSPILMSVFLMFVSGVRLTEKTITSRRPKYEHYQKTTNAFFPGPKRTVENE